jgi:FkbM family methyltransferase
MRWTKSLRHLDRLPEVWRCFRHSHQALRVTGRYLGIGSGRYPFHLELRNGLSLDLHEFHDLVTAWVVFFRNEYDVPASIATVLDLGANIGCFSLQTACNHPAARIIAVEPFPTTYDRLAAHVGLSVFRERIRIWNLGVAADSQPRWMPVAAPSPNRGMLGPGVSSADAVEVSVVSLEELFARACQEFGTESIDYVKMDVEGAEHEAILATPPSSLRVVRRLAMEYHPNRPKEPLFSHLSAAGLRLERERIIGRNVGIAHFCQV